MCGLLVSQAGLKLEEGGLNNVPPRPGSTVRDVLPIRIRGVASKFSAKKQKQKRNYPSSSVTHRQNDPEELKEKA